MADGRHNSKARAAAALGPGLAGRSREQGGTRPLHRGSQRAQGPRARGKLTRAVKAYLDEVLPRDAVCLPLGADEGDPAASHPDLLVLHRGRPLFLTLRPGDRGLSEGQRRLQASLLLAGALVVTCHNREDVVRTLRALEIWP